MVASEMSGCQSGLSLQPGLMFLAGGYYLGIEQELEQKYHKFCIILMTFFLF